MSKLSGKGSFLLMGDLNGKTNIEADYIQNDGLDRTIVQLPDGYIPDQEIRRRNRDTHKIDDQGKSILDFCIAANMRILN